MGAITGPALIVGEPARFDDNGPPLEADGDTLTPYERDAESDGLAQESAAPPM